MRLASLGLRVDKAGLLALHRMLPHLDPEADPGRSVLRTIQGIGGILTLGMTVPRVSADTMYG